MSSLLDEDAEEVEEGTGRVEVAVAATVEDSLCSSTFFRMGLSPSSWLESFLSTPLRRDPALDTLEQTEEASKDSCLGMLLFRCPRMELEMDWAFAEVEVKSHRPRERKCTFIEIIQNTIG